MGGKDAEGYRALVGSSCCAFLLCKMETNHSPVQRGLIKAAGLGGVLLWDCIFLSSPSLLPLQTVLAAGRPSQGCAAAAGGDALEQGWLLGKNCAEILLLLCLD